MLAAGPGVDLVAGTRVAGVVLGFDRDFGTYAEQLVVPAAEVAVVPEGLDLVAAATVPLNGLGAAQIVDLLGDAPADGNRLLVTGAAGAIGANVTALAPERGWQVTGLARTADEGFVRGLGADFVTEAEPGWDAVVDTTSQQVWGLTPVRDGGVFVGVRPNLAPAPERGITVHALLTQSDRTRLEQLLTLAESGRLLLPRSRRPAVGAGRRRPPGHGRDRNARTLRAPALTDPVRPGVDQHRTGTPAPH